MNISKIDLFPVSRTEQIETRHASVYMSIDSYEKNVSISDGTNTLNIVIDQEKMMRAFLYSLGNVRCNYDDAKREFIKHKVNFLKNKDVHTIAKQVDKMTQNKEWPKIN